MGIYKCNRTYAPPCIPATSGTNITIDVTKLKMV